MHRGLHLQQRRGNQLGAGIGRGYPDQRCSSKSLADEGQMNPNPLDRHSRAGDKSEMLSRYAGDFLIIWIPACAGMTQFYANGLFGMKRDFSLLAGRHFDLLVCGGGIYGAWVAYDAALRGLSVAIVEQGDWAGATSSASSKLIHGGLRYLETYDFKLVRKAILERQLLLELAPHRVWPLRFGVPIYKDSRIGTLQLKAGLMLYDFLARLSGKNMAGPAMASRHFDRAAFSRRFPALASDGLKGGYTYGDAQTDGARVVLEWIAGARCAGAVCVN